jgi:3-hydroxyisobutyrate dehydrogenase-like beta-hydroxyacid dehydrogenase
MTAARTPVGMIGLGLMGAALSARLIDAGTSVVGFDIDPAKRGAFGGEAAASPAHVAAQCRTIVIAVFDAEQVETVFDELRAGVADVIICATTCAPDEISVIAERAGALGLRLVEAPISGTSAEVRQGSAMALVAGGADAIDAARPVLDILCPRQTRVGGVGDAARTKLAINLILQNNRAALAEGIAFAECMGLDAAAFLRTARGSAAYSRVMDTKGDKMLARDFTAQSHIAQTLKDAELILEEARLRRQHLPMTLVQTALLRAAMTLAGPDADSAAVIEAIRPSPANGVSS